MLASFIFRKGVKAWENPVVDWINERYEATLAWIMPRRIIALVAALLWCLGVSGISRSAASSARSFCLISMKAQSGRAARWLPAPGPPRPTIMDQARLIFASFPEVTQVVSQVGRSDDGTDATGFFNTEYFVDLKPRNQWRSQFHGRKELLIEAMDKEVVENSRRELGLLAAHRRQHGRSGQRGQR